MKELKIASLFFVACSHPLSVSSSSSRSTGRGFLRDVVGGRMKEDSVPTEDMKERMHGDLLSKAVPLSDYNNGLFSKGRRTEEDDNMYNQDFYSFSGYSLKYSKCQTVQKFSDDAIENGDYSPMISEDIVILRLCPYKTCSANRQYGCHYNYAEYAISVEDYILIMVNYVEERMEKRCEWCRDCNERRGRRKLEEGEEDEGNEEGEDANDDGKAYYDYDGNYWYDANDECYQYGSYCDEDAYAYCNGNIEYDDYYVQTNEYVGYTQCALVENDYGEEYYVRPMCDASDGTIKMGVFYNEQCSKYAGDSISIDNFQVHFKDDIFEAFYEGSCVDCSSSNYPPNFDSNAYMCNMVHSQSAQCISNLEYDLFDVAYQNFNDTTECAFIESIRFGTYDEAGEISQSYAEGAQEQVTILQQIGLVVAGALCGILVLYSCYLHHSMTNLLIKSLSHRELLPPSRHSKRRTPASPQRRGKKSGGSKGSKSVGKRRGGDEDDDWASPASEMS